MRLFADTLCGLRADGTAAAGKDAWRSEAESCFVVPSDAGLRPSLSLTDILGGQDTLLQAYADERSAAGFPAEADAIRKIEAFLLQHAGDLALDDPDRKRVLDFVYPVV